MKISLDTSSRSTTQKTPRRKHKWALEITQERGSCERRGEQGKMIGVGTSWTCPGKVMLEDKRCLNISPTLPPRPFSAAPAAGTRSTPGVFPGEQGAHLGSGPALLLLTPLPPGPRRSTFRTHPLLPLTQTLLHLLAEAWNSFRRGFSFHNWKMGVLKCKQLVKNSRSTAKV